MITKQQVNHVLRLIKQKASKPDFSIIGGYHGVNLGDIALGESVRLILKKLNYKGGLQTIYNLDRWPWPTGKYTIIGGGAVGYTSSLLKLKDKLGAKYNKMAFLGVDFNEFKYNDDILTMLKEAAWISCRNEFQAKKLQEITGRNDISFHPDLVFSYKNDYCEKLRTGKKNKTLLVNVVPLYGDVVNGAFVPNENYREERPELYQNYTTFIESYKVGVQGVIKKALAEGFTIETVPFTPGDEIAAKVLLENLPVKHNTYTDNLDEMVERIGRAQKIFATRYHATILGIKTGAQLIPMAYATKNDKLLNELGISNDKFLSSVNLAQGTNVFPNAFTIDHSVVKTWEQAATKSMQNCVEKLLVN
jgi:hypothetical protein